MDLKAIQQDAWQTAEQQGFHANLDTLPQREQALIRLALIHTEVAECTQEIKRHGVTPQNVALIAEELADTIIRIADFAECIEHALGPQMDLGLAVKLKLELNKYRPKYYGTPQEGLHTGEWHHYGDVGGGMLTGDITDAGMLTSREALGEALQKGDS